MINPRQLSDYLFHSTFYLLAGSCIWAITPPITFNHEEVLQQKSAN